MGRLNRLLLQFAPINFRPAVGVPAQWQNGQLGKSVPGTIIKMATEPIDTVLGIDTRLAGADEGTVCLQKGTATPCNQIHSALVQVRSGNLAAPTDPDFIGAVRSPA